MFEDASAERAVLAIAVTSPDSIIDIEASLTEEDFITPHNKAVYTVLRGLYVTEGVSKFDLVSVIGRATQHSMLDQCGGYEYVESIFRTKVSRENLDVFVKQVVECSTKKSLYDKLTEVRAEVAGNVSGPGAKDADSLIQMADRGLTEVLVRSKMADDVVNLGDGIFQFLDELEALETSVVGLQTGVEALDKRINGLIPGSLTILVARPKVGKSTMLMGWAKNICYAASNPKPLLYIDTEMSTKEVRTRMLSNLSGVKERIISNGSYRTNTDYRERVRKAAEIMAHGEFYHKYVPGVTIDQVVSLGKKYYVNHGIAALFFDYVKVTDTSQLANVKEHQLLGNIASGLKDLAGELSIPVVTAAQIGRAGANTGYLRADMIADSDRLLRYCNTLLGLCRKSTEELNKVRDTDGPESYDRYIRMNGLHRLQVLDTRAGGTLFEGINIASALDTLSFWQADFQPKHVYEGIDSQEGEGFI